MSKLRDLLENPALKSEIAALKIRELKNQQREKLKHLIAEVSEAWGGDSAEHLQNHTEITLSNWDNNLEEAIACYEASFPATFKLKPRGDYR